MKNLQDIVEQARKEAKRRGFHSLGIYHLLWVLHTQEPELMGQCLKSYGVDPAPFIKMLENTLRPRRAGGGVPRDRQDAALAEDAISRAGCLDRQPTCIHLLRVLPELEEDPIVALCDRFGLACNPPECSR